MTCYNEGILPDPVVGTAPKKITFASVRQNEGPLHKKMKGAQPGQPRTVHPQLANVHKLIKPYVWLDVELGAEPVFQPVVMHKPVTVGPKNVNRPTQPVVTPATTPAPATAPAPAPAPAQWRRQGPMSYNPKNVIKVLDGFTQRARASNERVTHWVGLPKGPIQAEHNYDYLLEQHLKRPHRY